MKKLIRAFTLFALLMATTAILTTTRQAEAQTSGFLGVESSTNLTPCDYLTINTGLNRQFNSWLSGSAFFQETGEWAQAYAGPTWTPNKGLGRELRVNFSFGVEQGPNGFRPRYATSTYAKSGRLVISWSVEFNHKISRISDVWYDANLMLEISPWLSVGLKDRLPIGAGPFMQLRVGKVEIGAQWAVTHWIEQDHHKGWFHPKSTLIWAKYHL